MSDRPRKRYTHSHFTEHDVNRIFVLRELGLCVEAIGLLMRTSGASISSILKRKTFAYYPLFREYDLPERGEINADTLCEWLKAWYS